MKERGRIGVNGDTAVDILHDNSTLFIPYNQYFGSKGTSTS